MNQKVLQAIFEGFFKENTSDDFINLVAEEEEQIFLLNDKPSDVCTCERAFGRFHLIQDHI